MKVKQFGNIISDGKNLRFELFNFERSCEGEPATYACIIKAVCEYLNSTIDDNSFKPLVDVITGKQV